ncbi:hypothetical protein H0H81_004828 [Sphagnurus paluster]|uniref:PB1 domain-containing protein n=1 Tax=Sphagnurus paluster TaxID=117069 RepID=A0A9P7K579_9AGAR|nr:hypothetical protein H0H81_004828 [Sphagnurus paluster]
MTTTHFKLTEPNGFTRRVTFSEQPTWKALSTRIELLYGIPVERVSVSYLDADNDQVTLSSQDELDDYYLNLHQPGRAIKFTVQDLTSARLQRNIQTHPQTTNFRNTFGFDIDEDWQNLVIPPITDLGGFFNAASHDKVDSRGFIEVVESHSSVDDDAQHDLDHRSSSPSSMQSSPNSPFMIPLDKGKGRATAFDGVSSTASLLGEDAPPKHPVHVYDLSHLDSDPSAAPFSAPTVPAVSAPKVTTPDVILEPAAAAKDIAPPAEDDPPLPSIEEETTSTPTPQESPSLSSDIAAFMHTLTNVVASHPELSEGIRNIVRNASSGAYWHAHREAISRAAQDITQESGITQNLRRETEEEAGRHVAEALGGVFRSLSQTLSGQPSVSHPVTPDATAPPNTENNGATGTADVPPGPVFADTVHPQPQLPPRPPFNPWVHRSMSFGHWGQGSPRAPFGGPPIPPPPVPMPTGWHGWVPPPGPPPPPPPPSNPPPPHTLGAQELRAQVDAAKARYKAEKERYRIEREERRKERERRAKMVADEP